LAFEKISKNLLEDNMSKYLTLLIIFSNSFWLNLSAWAGYVPPAKQQPPSDYSRSTGVRSGCFSQTHKSTLTLLAPQTYVGMTTSTRPQFIWSVWESLETDFRLFELSGDGEVKQHGKSVRLTSKPGVNIFTLPVDSSPLRVGTKYLWQIGVRCPNGNLVLERAELQVVASSQGLDSPRQNADKVEQYAQQGFWYDALATSLTLAQAGKLGELGADLISSLAKSEIPPDFASLNNDQQAALQQRQKTLEEIALDYR
jgi:hypothetical protein